MTANTKNVPVPVTVEAAIDAALHLMLAEKLGQEVAETRNEYGEKLGKFFQALAVKWKDDIKLPPRDKKESFHLQGYDTEMSRLEDQIASRAAQDAASYGIEITTKGMTGFRLPRSWRQYKSNVKKWIGLGLAKQFGEVGIGKITQGITQAERLNGAARDVFAANIHNLRTIVDYAVTSTSKMQTNEKADAFKAYRDAMHREMQRFITACNEIAHKHGRAGVTLVKAGTHAEFNNEAVPMLVEGKAKEAKPTMSVPESAKPEEETVRSGQAEPARRSRGRRRAA